MNKKRLIITSIISIFLVATLMIGSTYSVFTSSDIDENTNVYTTGNLKVTYKSSSNNVFFTNIKPMTEQQADSVIPYRVTVTNSGTVPYQFDLILDNTTAGESIDSQYIMTKVGYLETRALSECTDNKIKEDIILPAGESINIDVRVWMSDTISNTEIGKSFYAKLSIDGLGVYADSTDINNEVLSLKYMKIPKSTVFKSDTYKTYIKNASFVDYIDTSNASLDENNELILWDMSTVQDNSIIAWLEDNESDGYYDLYIGCRNKIYANSLNAFFLGMTSLESIDFDNLDTSLTTDMLNMFSGCSSLTSLDLSNFDTSNVTEVSYMFSGCSSLTSLDLSSFDTSNVTRMYEMFFKCSGLINLDVSSFDTSNVTTMNRMFYGCHNLISLDVSRFDTSNVVNMEKMFTGCTSLTSLDVSNFDTSNVMVIFEMFSNCSGLINLELGDFDITNITSLSGMFSGCSSLTNIDLSNLETGHITDMTNMFYNCSSLISIDLSNLDTSSVVNMKNMFFNCSSLTSLDLSNFDTSNVTTMYAMFRNCSSLTSLDLSDFDTSNVTNMGYMFSGCSNLTNLNLNSFDTSSVTEMGAMFMECGNLNTILTVRNIDTTYGSMFLFSASSSSSKITVNYTSNTSSLVDSMIATKSSYSNVVKGILVE